MDFIPLVLQIINVLKVTVAGICGGIGRGLVEAPIDFMKVRAQVGNRWTFRELSHGASVTIGRNSILFSSFATYMDIVKQVVPNIGGFWLGAIAANMAWLTVWPIDVVKTRVQSGLYTGMSNRQVLVQVWREGLLFRGLAPGLVRSTLANGTSMMVYQVRVNHHTFRLRLPACVLCAPSIHYHNKVFGKRIVIGISHHSSTSCYSRYEFAKELGYDSSVAPHVSRIPVTRAYASV